MGEGQSSVAVVCTACLCTVGKSARVYLFMRRMGGECARIGREAGAGW